MKILVKMNLSEKIKILENKIFALKIEFNSNFLNKYSDPAEIEKTIEIYTRWKKELKNLVKNKERKEKLTKINMKSIIVGGNFGLEPKESSIVKQLSQKLNSDVVNGGTLEQLSIASSNVKNYDLIIWSANVDNSYDKIYPIKSNGSILICTKVLRENQDFGDAVARIFKMNANAVISIDSSQKPFKFHLIDALGNNWCSTSDLDELTDKIFSLCSWTKDSIRIKSVSTDMNLPKNKNLDKLCSVVKIIADKVENERGGRYFGNVSTRCAKMFPSMKTDNLVLVSGRNTSKERLTSDDFVYTYLDEDKVYYHGDKKPSIDTPVQLNLYNFFKNINYIVHGHAYIREMPSTIHYYPCGDLRELYEIQRVVVEENCNLFILNLKNHGFIIGAKNIEVLENLAKTLDFQYRNIGEERI